MPQFTRKAPLAWIAAVLCAGAFVAGANAAPKPVPEMSAEERAMRELVRPLREGVTEGPALQPLHDWIAARAAAGRARTAERDLRRLLKRIHDEFNHDLMNSAEWVHTMQVQRSKLYTDISDDNVSGKHAIQDFNELPAVPLEEDLLPTHVQLPDGFGAGPGPAPDSSAPRQDALDPMLPDDGASTMTVASSTDLDGPQMLDRLTLDLTILGHLLHACDNEYEQEKERHRQALATLTAILKARPKA